MTSHIKSIIAEIENTVNYKVVYLGMGNSFKRLNHKAFDGWIKHPSYSNPQRSTFYGTDKHNQYFAPLDSDIARINGHVPRTKEISRKITL